MNCSRTSLIFCCLFLAVLACLAAHAQQPEPDLFAYGLPTADYSLRGDFALSFNGMSKCPRWTLEHLNAAKLKKHADREGIAFHVDKEIPEEFAASPQDYAGSGFDLGHAAAAANHARTETLLRGTFTVANAMPQRPDLNRGAWKNLEASIRTEAEKKGVNVWVVTAPIYEPGRRLEAIGDSKVWIPHHCGKAVLIDDNGALRIQAWIMSNERCSEPLSAYAVTVDTFERRAGIDVYAALNDATEKRLEAAAPGQ
jgi:endonuclease G